MKECGRPARLLQRLVTWAGGPPAPRFLARGFALGISISLLAVVFLLGLAYSVRASFHLQNTVRTVTSLQGQYLSQAGMRYALAQVSVQIQQRQQQQQRQGQFFNWQWQPFGNSFTFDTGTVQVSGQPNGQVMNITSRSRTNRGGRLVTAVVDWNGNIVQWTEAVQ